MLLFFHLESLLVRRDMSDVLRRIWVDFHTGFQVYFVVPTLLLLCWSELHLLSALRLRITTIDRSFPPTIVILRLKDPVIPRHRWRAYSSWGSGPTTYLHRFYFVVSALCHVPPHGDFSV